MSDRPRLLVPALMGVLVVAALAFAIAAGNTGTSGNADTDASAGGAPSAGTAVSPSGSGGFDGAALPAGVPAPGFTLTRTGRPEGVAVRTARKAGRAGLPLLHLWRHLRSDRPADPGRAG